MIERKEPGNRERDQEVALWSFFFGKQVVENVHHHTPAHPRLIGQDIEAAGRCIER